MDQLSEMPGFIIPKGPNVETARDRVPLRGVTDRSATTISGLGRIDQMARAGHTTTTSSLSVAMLSSAGALRRPFVVLFEQYCADEADNGFVVGEDANDLGSTFDFAVEALQAVGRVDLGPVIGR